MCNISQLFSKPPISGLFNYFSATAIHVIFAQLCLSDSLDHEN